MLLLGICVYLIVTISKPAFIKLNQDGVKKLILSSVKMGFQKNNPVSIFSFLQLIALAWMLTGIIEIVLEGYISRLPHLLISALELFVPLILVIVIVQVLMKK